MSDMVFPRRNTSKLRARVRRNKPSVLAVKLEGFVTPVKLAKDEVETAW